MRSMSNLWKKYQKPSDMYASIKLLLFISYFFGITPFRISGPVGNREMKVTFIGFFNAVITTIAFIICFILSLVNGESLAGYFFNTSISMVGDTLQKFTGLFGLSMIYIASLLRRNAIIKLIASIAEIDNNLEDLGVTMKYKKTQKYSNIIILGTVVINVVYIIGSVQTIHSLGECPSWPALVSFFSPQMIVSLNVVMFLSFTNKLKQRFSVINEVLKGVSESNNERHTAIVKSRPNSFQCFSIYPAGERNLCSIIDDTMKTHCLICDAASTANKYFTYQLLTIVSISFLIIVFDAYYLLETILGQPRQEVQFNTIEFIAFFSSQLVLYLLAVFAIVEGSNNAIFEGEQTSSFVHKLLNTTKDPDLKQKLSYFSMQLVHEKVSFSAAGLFKIDRTLYFTISGAATTYLIILLQFTSSGSRDKYAYPHQNGTQNV